MLPERFTYIFIMPLLSTEQLQTDIWWGIWKIEESTELLMNSIYLSSSERTEFKKFSNEKRGKEWLGARNILNILLNQLGFPYYGLDKNSNKKPILRDIPVHISLAHSYPYAVAMINLKSSCGMDIEKTKPALIHVSPRFLSDAEQSFIDRDLEGLCIAWTAKESIYKMYGQIQLSFKHDMILYPYKVKEKGQITASVRVNDQNQEHVLFYRKMDDYFICFSYS